MAGELTKEWLQAEAQAAVDELYSEKKLPFRFTAHKIERSVQAQEYTIEFYDSRLPLLSLLWLPSQLSFRTLVKEAMLREAEIRGWLDTPT